MKRITVREFRANIIRQAEPVEVGDAGTWYPKGTEPTFGLRRLSPGELLLDGHGEDLGVSVPVVGIVTTRARDERAKGPQPAQARDPDPGPRDRFRSPRTVVPREPLAVAGDTVADATRAAASGKPTDRARAKRARTVTPTEAATAIGLAGVITEQRAVVPSLVAELRAEDIGTPLPIEGEVLGEHTDGAAFARIVGDGPGPIEREVEAARAQRKAEQDRRDAILRHMSSGGRPRPAGKAKR